MVGPRVLQAVGPRVLQVVGPRVFFEDLVSDMTRDHLAVGAAQTGLMCLHGSANEEWLCCGIH